MIEMNRKIRFQVTSGSHFPENVYPSLPIGGIEKFVEIEFETDNTNPMKDAEKSLDEKMGGGDYHIWYWWWLD